MATRIIVTRIDLRPASEDHGHHHEDGVRICCPETCSYTEEPHPGIETGNPGPDPLPHTSTDSRGEGGADVNK